MNEIGELLRQTREDSGVSLEEASGDLEIKTLILENIEDGNIGCFKDIFVLKDYIYDYAKYLGLDVEEIIDEDDETLEISNLEEIETMEAQLEEEAAPVEDDIDTGDDYYPDDAPMDFGGNDSLSDLGADDTMTDDAEVEGEDDTLPTPAELDVGDMSDSSNPELEN